MTAKRHILAFEIGTFFTRYVVFEDGRMGIPTVFDADGPDTKRRGTRFRLKSVKQLERDFLWLRYAKA